MHQERARLDGGLDSETGPAGDPWPCGAGDTGVMATKVSPRAPVSGRYTACW